MKPNKTNGDCAKYWMLVEKLWGKKGRVMQSKTQMFFVFLVVFSGIKSFYRIS